jgi:O-antigen/teichoic acid export membrane protein
MFSKMLNLKQNPNELVLFSFFLLITPAIILVVNSIFFNKEIIDLLYTEHNILSAKVFSVLISTLIPISITYIFGTLLTANGSIRYLNIIAFIGVVVSLLLNIILIPKLKALGTAYAAIITQSITGLLQMILSFYFFKIKISIKKIIAFIIFIVSLITITYFIHYYISNWLIAISISILIGIVLAFILKMINIKSIFALLKSNDE